MNPESENTLNNNIPEPKDDSSSLAAPGGVISPSGYASPAQPTPPAPQESRPLVPPEQPSSPDPLGSPSTAIFQSQNNPVGEPNRPNNVSSGPNPEIGGGRQIFPSDSPVSSANGGRKLNKKLFLVAVPILIVLLAGFVFGYYIPNKPENVYKTGLDRTGDALGALIDKGTDLETRDKFKNSEITATLDINYDNQKISGDFTAKYDESQLDTDLNLSFPPNEGMEEAKLGFSLLSSKAEAKQFPDLYFNARGIDAFGADLFLPGISKYDGKWVAVSSDYFQFLADEYGLDPEEQIDYTENLPTFDEVSSIVKDLYSVTNEHIFTSDPGKAVLENRKYLGKEEVDGIDAYHYEVGFNKENAKTYCEAVATKLIDNSAYRKFIELDTDGEVEAEKQRTKELCQGYVDAIKDDQTFEMWVDSKYKLIKKIRVYSDADKSAYYEIGQNYDGSDKISLFFAYTSARGGFDNTKIIFTTDLNTGESSGELTFSGGEEADRYDGTITLKTKPLAQDFEIKRPKDVVSIEKLLKEIGINPKNLALIDGASSGSAGDSSSGRDAYLKTNINKIYAELEVYYALNGYYPTKSQFNSTSWQADNMASIDDSMLSGVRYAPFECSANNCKKYNLRAKLSNGEEFIKISTY